MFSSTKPWWISQENRNVLTYEEEYNDQYPTTSIDLLEQAFLVLDENFFEAGFLLRLRLMVELSHTREARARANDHWLLSLVLFCSFEKSAKHRVTKPHQTVCQAERVTKDATRRALAAEVKWGLRRSGITESKQIFRNISKI